MSSKMSFSGAQRNRWPISSAVAFIWVANSLQVVGGLFVAYRMEFKWQIPKRVQVSSLGSGYGVVIAGQIPSKVSLISAKENANEFVQTRIVHFVFFQPLELKLNRSSLLNKLIVFVTSKDILIYLFALLHPFHCTNSKFIAQNPHSSEIFFPLSVTSLFHPQNYSPP